MTRTSNMLRKTTTVAIFVLIGAGCAQMFPNKVAKGIAARNKKREEEKVAQARAEGREKTKRALARAKVRRDKSEEALVEKHEGAMDRLRERAAKKEETLQGRYIKRNVRDAVMTAGCGASRSANVTSDDV